MTGARPFYDLTNPIVYHRDEATIEGADDTKVVVKTRRPSQSILPPFELQLTIEIGTGLQDFENYANALLNSVIATSPTFGSFPSSDDRRRSSTIMEAPPAERPEMRARTGTSAIIPGQVGILKEEMEDLPDEGDGCKSAVEIVSRNSKKGLDFLFGEGGRELMWLE